METKSTASWSACLFFVVVSCGGSQPPAGTPPASSPSAQAPTAPASSASWKDMNTEQRKQYMKTVVYPKMKEDFAGFDAKRYAEMTCVTCHGDGAKDGSFKMPNPKLPKLPSDEAGFKALMEKKPEATKFMGSKVVPGMASMLGEQPFNPQTHEGFGCFECHTK
jgi:hypothetical protein